MIAVEKVLAKLIGEYEFVIIPGFGALLCNHIPASFDPVSGYFNPPFKKLAFNEYLKLDDGTLANYISRHEQIAHPQAVDHVKRFADQLKAALTSQDKVSIAGIGEFNKNIEGKLVFEPFVENHFKDEWYGFQPVRTSVKVMKPFVPEPFREISVTESEVEVLDDTQTNRVSYKWLRGVAAAAVILLLCGLSVLFVNSPENAIQSTLNPFKELFSGKAEQTETASVPVEPLEPVKEKTVEVAEVNTESAVNLPTIATDSVKQPVPAEVTVAPAKGNFYVVAGAFKGGKQANILLEELKGKGFENALILPGNKYSTKVKVAIDSYETEKEAYKASSALRKSIGVEGWVFKKK